MDVALIVQGFDPVNVANMVWDNGRTNNNIIGNRVGIKTRLGIEVCTVQTKLEAKYSTKRWLT